MRGAWVSGHAKTPKTGAECRFPGKSEPLRGELPLTSGSRWRESRVRPGEGKSQGLLSPHLLSKDPKEQSLAYPLSPPWVTTARAQTAVTPLSPASLEVTGGAHPYLPASPSSKDLAYDLCTCYLICNSCLNSSFITHLNN